MKVTAIKQQVKRADRYTIFIDSKYAFSLSANGLLASGLSVGQEFSRSQREVLDNTVAFDQLYGKVLRYLAIRPRSEWEVSQYLKKHHSPATFEQQILSKLSNNHLLNDQDFAKAWVENRRLLKPVSHRRLSAELRAKRISGEVIQAVLEEDETKEVDVLAELVARKRRLPKYQDNLALMQYLARQGFSYGDIKEVLRTPDTD